MSNWKEHFEKLRGWLDGEKQDDFAEKLAQVQENRSESEIFLQKLLNSVEGLLKAEMVRIPNTNKAYVPEKFSVYISTEADKSLRDDKRRFFEHSLSALIIERAKEMAGRLELTSKKLSVEILVNALLEGDEVEVKVSSENEQKKGETIQLVIDSENLKFNKTVDLTGKKDKAEDLAGTDNKTIEDLGTLEDLGTIDDLETFMGILYRVEIWQTGKKINEIPIVQKKVTVGRDDADKVANLRLPTENRKISRSHAEINLEDYHEIWVTALHKNPTIVSGRPLRNSEKARLSEGGEIQIYDFTLKVKLSK